MNFVHLHAHSHYSLLEALPKIDELVYAAKKMGMTALALTDYGSLYGAIEFYKTAKRAGIKPIIGFEAYLAPGSRLDQSPHQEIYHLTLLAENEIGYKNLMLLSSLGHLEGFNLVPRIDQELLQQHHEGIIALSGCLESEIAKLIYQRKDLAKAKKAAQKLAQIFGPDYFYLELQDHPDLPGQVEVNNALIQIAEEINLPLVVSRDVHYLTLEDREAQEIMTCIKNGWTIDAPNRPNFLSVDRSFNTQEDVISRFRHIPAAIANTAKIAERCNLELKLGSWHFPPVAVPAGRTANEELDQQAREGLKSLIPNPTPDIEERLNYELDIIKKKRYAPYFLAVADYVRWAREQGIIATTRGSAAGSLVTFCLSITTVNPLYFKLPFERFLNPFRPSPPDIDMDFADNRRDEVIGYITQKYGADKVAQIVTFGTMMARASVRDVGRALGYSYNFCDQVAKIIPFGSQGFPMTIQRALQAAPELYALYNENEKVKRLLDLAQKIEGCVRHTSIHAAGIVIAPTVLTDFTPVQRETGGEKITTQYEMHSVEEAGLLKMDILGIRNLSILGDAVKIVAKTLNVKVDLQNIPWDDKKSFAMLARGETGGLFQLGGSGMTRYLEELKPSNIFDIMAMVALFRPGPMESIPEFIRRKHNPKAITYLDPRMKDYLDKSYGVITYQDDVLLTAINIAGYSWEEADKLRKAMGKKIPEEMAAQKEKFVSGCLKNGLDLKKSNELWGLIEPFAAYGFNKSHAASYAVVAYQTAYMKAHFPEEYMAAVLSAEAGDIEKVSEIVGECKQMGIVVLPPDINESFELFAVVPRKTPTDRATIRFGLEAIKNVGGHIAEIIIRERKANGPYQSLEDFLRRVQDKDLNKKSLESLIKCGALDRFGERGQLLANIELLTSFVRDSQKEKQSKQTALFEGAIQILSRLALKTALPATKDERLAWEKELIGLYISEHPFAELEKGLAKDFPRLKQLLEEKNTAAKWLIAGGFISAAKRVITKKGESMLFVTLQDTTASVEIVVFPRIYEQFKSLLKEGEAVCLLGRFSEREGEKEKKIIAEQFESFKLENAAQIKTKISAFLKSQNGAAFNSRSAFTNLPELIIPIKGQLPLETITALKQLFKNYPGGQRVFLLAGDKKIDTKFSVEPTEEFGQKLKKILE